MEKFFLHLRAPFAAYRMLQTGAYRSTLPTIPHSAAFGLILNLAGIDTSDGELGTATLEGKPIDPLRIAVGNLTPPTVSSLFQQMHIWPVGPTGKTLKSKTFGSKYNITTIRREVLVSFDAIIGVDCPIPGFRQRVQNGLEGDTPRFGLPFAGDNSFLFEQLEIVSPTHQVRWYTPLQQGGAIREGSCRLTVGINRVHVHKTTAVLCAPEEIPTTDPPESAWIWTPKAPEVTHEPVPCQV